MREKLVELLREVQYQGNAVHGYHDQYIQNSELADHLIANGVTFATDNNVGSKWIPVTERLPEDLPENKGKKVINCIVAHSPYANGKSTSQFRQRKWDKWDNKWYWSKIGACTVTHWMPLPEPPKEVE